MDQADETTRETEAPTASIAEVLEQLRGVSTDETGELSLQLFKKKDGTKNKMEYATVYTVDEFDMQRVQREWGAGDYEVRIRGPKALMERAKQEVGQLSKSFSIIAPPAPAAAAPGVEMLTRMLAEMQTKLEQLQRNPPAVPQLGQGVNPLEVATQMTTLLTQQTDRMLTLLMPLIVAKAAPAPAAAEGGATGLLEAIKFGISIARPRRDPDAGGESALTTAVKVLAGPLGRALEMHAAGAPGEVAAAPLPGGQNVTAVAAAQPQNPLEMLRPHVARIKAVSESGMDPAAAVNVFEAMLPNESAYLQQLAAANGQDKLLAAIYETYPDLQPCAAWLGEFVSELCAPPDDDAAS